MIGKPGGNLARTYEWHIEALSNDPDGRFNIDDITSMEGKNIDISTYDIFWFYAKAFQPEVYYVIKNRRPDAKIICGPNILLDKPDVGASDDWDRWYMSSCRPDIHLDQVKFYSDHVKKFLSPETVNNAETLDKCMNEFPRETVNYSFFAIPIADVYFKAGAKEKGMNVLSEMSEDFMKEYKFFS